MNKQFTPGPWKECAAHLNYKILDRDENYRSISAGEGYFNIKGNRDTGFEISGFMLPADSRLIAAAPEMFDLLEKFCEQCNKQNIEGIIPEYEQAITLLQRITNQHY